MYLKPHNNFDNLLFKRLLSLEELGLYLILLFIDNYVPHNKNQYISINFNTILNNTQNNEKTIKKLLITLNKKKIIKKIIYKNKIKIKFYNFNEPKKSSRRKNISSTLRNKILKRDNYKCVLCKNSPALNKECILEMDHIKPISKGGTNDINNLQTLCKICNMKKGTKYEK